MSTPTQPSAPGAEFNTPPNWPANPPGWTPEPGWQPDPAWGPAPEGWQWWVPAPSPYTVPAAQATPEPGVPTESQRRLQDRARNYFLGGAALATVASITTLLAESKGGAIWTGGFIVGALFWVRAGRYTADLRRNGVNLSTTAKAVAAVTAAITLILAGVAGADMYKMQKDKPTSSDPSRNSVGSCWSHKGAEKVLHVACSSGDATLIVTSKVTDAAQCPAAYLVRSDYYLCLSPK